MTLFYFILFPMVEAFFKIETLKKQLLFTKMRAFIKHLDYGLSQWDFRYKSPLIDELILN